MKQLVFTILENKPLTETVYKMRLSGDCTDFTRPGQFLNIRLEGLFLRRPISVCDWTEDSVTILYKVVGTGTRKMAGMKEGETLDILTGLGNGYDTEKSGAAPLLVGGGVGVPPLFGLCRTLIAEGKTPTVILGFNTANEVFYEEEFKALGANVIVATADGSRGVKGFAAHAMEGLNYTYVYTCGPKLMLKSVYDAASTSGQFSFEERMGCGFGACMGCTCETKYGNKRICRDGPVLEKEEIIW